MILPQRENILPKRRNGAECFEDNFLSGDWQSDWKLLTGSASDVVHSETSLDITYTGLLGIASCWHIFNVKQTAIVRLDDANSNADMMSRVRSDLSDAVLYSMDIVGGNTAIIMYKVINGVAAPIATSSPIAHVNGARWLIEATTQKNSASVVATNLANQQRISASATLTDSDILDPASNNYCGIASIFAGSNQHFEYYRQERL
jgi:hypothetical protein